MDTKAFSDIQRQELHCHECNQYVQFDLDMSLNGNHVLNCPNCGHEHCRVIEDGKITGDRWDQRNGNAGMIIVSTATASWTTTSTFDTSTSATDSASGGTFLYSSWMNVTAT